jgi:uncharacterized protein YbbC (DUF1343 family)
MHTGLESLLTDCPARLKGGRAGLICNSASLSYPDGTPAHAISLLRGSEFELVRLFGPEHGLYSAANEGGHVADGFDVPSGLPVISLYGPRRAPEAQHLQDLGALLVDLQDVGVRAYTFLSTLKACLQVCAEADTLLIVLDRPNPLGRISAGPGLESGFESFVGAHDLRFLHGMTLGEAAQVMAHGLTLEDALLIMPMSDWQGEPWEQTGLPWAPPSPNLPRLESVYCYPATVFFEGTNLSEGRGTEAPFEQVGAPWLDGVRLADRLNARGLLGVKFTAAEFTPERSKHAGVACQGVSLEVQSAAFKPLEAALALLQETKRQSREAFEFLTPKSGKPFIDLLYGSDRLRSWLSGELGEAEFRACHEAGERLEAARVKLYGSQPRA